MPNEDDKREKMKDLMKESVTESISKYFNRPLYPAPYTIFKGKAEIQFSPMAPSTLDNNSTRKGSIKIEITSCENKKCDWDNKIIFALGPDDIAKILKGFKNQPSDDEKSKGLRVKLIHAIGNKSKALSIVAHRDKSHYINVFQKEGDNKIKHSILVDEGEMAVILSLLKSSLLYMLGWWI